jgi:hypothetical protein
MILIELMILVIGMMLLNMMICVELVRGMVGVMTVGIVIGLWVERVELLLLVMLRLVGFIVKILGVIMRGNIMVMWSRGVFMTELLGMGMMCPGLGIGKLVVLRGKFR